MLQLTCNNPFELDYVTNSLNLEFPGISGLESSTFVVASAEERLPRYVEGKTLVLDISTELRDEHAQFLRQIEQNHIISLPEHLRSAYLQASQGDRLFLLQALDSFDKSPDRSFMLSNVSFEEVKADFVDNFVQGFLVHSSSHLSHAAMTIAKFVEDVSKRSLRECLSLVYPVHKLGLAQNELKIPDNLNRLTLGQVLDSYRSVNKDSRFQRIGMQFDDVLLEEFHLFSQFRNRAAHGMLDGLIKDDFSAGVQQIREAYHRAVRILRQLRVQVFEVNYLPVALQAALEQKDQDVNVHRVISELKIDVRETGERIQARIGELEGRSQRRLLAILQSITRLDQSIQAQQRQQQQIVDLLIVRQDEILRNTQPSQEPLVRRVLQTIASQGKELPANVLANLIATMLSGLSQPYLVQFLAELGQLLR
jgi:hypothetical protein